MDTKKIPTNTITRDIKDLAEPTGNIYESVVILYKRANQIALAEKKELSKKLEDFKNYLIRRGDAPKDISKWKLGKKLSNLEIPTDDVDLDTGKTGKRRVLIQEGNKKIQGRTIYTRYISDEEVALSSIESLIETGDVV